MTPDPPYPPKNIAQSDMTHVNNNSRMCRGEGIVFRDKFQNLLECLEDLKTCNIDKR